VLQWRCVGVPAQYVRTCSYLMANNGLLLESALCCCLDLNAEDLAVNTISVSDEWSSHR